MEKQIWFARNPGGKRAFLTDDLPYWDGERWRSDGDWIEVPGTWLTDVTFENSPRRIRSLTLHRTQ